MLNMLKKDIRALCLIAYLAIFSLMATTCSTISIRTTTRCVPLDIPPASIPEVVEPGKIVHIGTKHIVVLMKVTGYESDGLLVGIDEIDGGEVRVAINEIEAICIQQSVRETYDRWEEGEPSLGNELAYGLPFLLTSPLWAPSIVMAPYQIYIDEKRSKEEKEIQNILDAEREIYDRMTTEQIQTKLGKPRHKYACKELHFPAYSQVWEYSDERLPVGKKYFFFSPISKELYFISYRAPEGCLLFKGAPPEPTLQEISEYEARKEALNIDRELRSLQYANDTLLRGDMEATYRLLEDGLISEYPEVQKKARQFIKQHPDILECARRSFSTNSLKISIGKYRKKEARNIESQRLSIYKTVAPAHDYKKARQNFENIFGFMQ